VVSPCEGTGYEIGAMSLVMSGPNPALGKRFFDYALSPQAQELAAEVKSFQAQSNRQVPIPARVANMSDIKLINYNHARYGSATERTHLLGRWQQSVGVPALK
jgi:iron(III) transport system substrate-binding protein